MLFIAPLLLGGDDGHALLSGTGVVQISDAWRLSDMRFRQIDSDILIEGEVATCSPD
jgi:diaminohydroxyphosphoribosylaminopyrimidine deaminase/5-amino-6-(5-phosphoribosylamino)uracil reductase